MKILIKRYYQGNWFSVTSSGLTSLFEEMYYKIGSGMKYYNYVQELDFEILKFWEG